MWEVEIRPYHCKAIGLYDSSLCNRTSRDSYTSNRATQSYCHCWKQAVAVTVE